MEDLRPKRYAHHVMTMRWRAQVKLEPRCDVQLWRQKPDYWTIRTWDHAGIHLLMFMCAVWKMSWVLVVTLSLVSCSVTPRKSNTKCRVFSFRILESTYALSVRLYSKIVNFLCSQIYAHFCIANTDHLRCCLYTPVVTVDRRQL